MAFARTAPVAPAIALPHGGRGAALVEGAMWMCEAQCLVPSPPCAGSLDWRVECRRFGVLGRSGECHRMPLSLQEESQGAFLEREE